MLCSPDPNSSVTSPVMEVRGEIVMRQRRAGGEEIAEHFDSLPRSAGTAEERLAATARYFKVDPRR